MTILADHQIRDLCIPSKTILDDNDFIRALKKEPNALDLLFPTDESHTRQRREIVDVLKRLRTQEEYDSFVPMIENFVERQVRNLKSDLSTAPDILVVSCNSDKLRFTLVDEQSIRNQMRTLSAFYDEHTQTVFRGKLFELNSKDITQEEALVLCPKLDLENGSQMIHLDTKLISYGLTSFGYDVRLAEDKFVIFTNHQSGIIDPKKADPKRDTTPLEIRTDRHGCKYVIMPAHSYGMGYTMEYFNVPRNVNIICLGKSTYARSSVFVNVTPIEAGFKGNVVIELGNCTGSPVKVYLGEGIAQFQFQQGVECEVSYGDRDGKYQGQTKLTYSRM